MSLSEYYTDAQKLEMLDLVRKTIEANLENTSYSMNNIPDYMNETRSCFVTLHTKEGNLRGCIGNIAAFESLYDNIRNNAINSAFGDPRFQHLSDKTELNNLEIEISVLTPLTKVNSYEDIILGKHGIILKHAGNGAVFLPQVATEQGWDLNTTLSHLSMKAGLQHDAWKHPNTKFEIFEAIVFKE